MGDCSSAWARLEEILRVELENTGSQKERIKEAGRRAFLLHGSSRHRARMPVS